jgi:glycosyltransferase involved in cell wall biosynthesis
MILTTAIKFSRSTIVNNSMKTDSLPAIDSLDKNRLSAASRLQSANVFEEIENDSWQLRSNASYKKCKSPCVSVIITLYNYSKYVRQCLDSVCSSNFEHISDNVEIIVIDDRSTDDSAEVVDAYLERSNASICLVKKYLNTGLVDARNIGLKIARSPYVFVLDADNWISPNCLSILYDRIKSEDYASVYGKIQIFANETQEYCGIFSDKEWSIADLVRDPYIDAMAMFNRQILLDLGGYSTELIEYGWGLEDYDLWLKLAQKGYLCKLVPEILTYYRVHSSSMINTTNFFKLNMSRYFNCKFSDLAKTVAVSDKLFGSKRSKVEGINYQKLSFSIAMYQELRAVMSINIYQELNQCHATIDSMKSTISQCHSTISQCHATIDSMKSTKFWKLRDKWFRLKEILGLAKIKPFISNRLTSQ